MLIFAHRGASADAPENTLLAIKTAIDQQADGIEIDVYQSEKTLIVIHDKWLHRTTNGQGQLSLYSFKQLRELDAGGGQKIPTLQEVLQLVGGQCQINIELKGISELSLLLELIDVSVSEYGFNNQQFLISSFNHHLLAQLKALRPQIKIGALTASLPLHYAAFAEELQAYSVNLDVSFINQAFVNDAHQRDLKVFVYTVDQPDDLAMLFSWGVDGVFCNAPGLAKRFINSIQS